jgi:hypothetical protein
MADNLRRLVELAQKTGDTLIVTDKNGHEPVVIMDVAKYEALLDIGYETGAHDLSYHENPSNEPTMDDFQVPMEEYRPETHEEAPIVVEELPTEEPHPVVDQDNGPDDEPGEERFYLEPIE